jgi:hypothetical protein
MKKWKILQLISILPYVLYILWAAVYLLYAYFTNEVYDFPQDNMGIYIRSSFESAQFGVGMITMGIIMTLWPVLIILAIIFFYSLYKIKTTEERQ